MKARLILISTLLVGIIFMSGCGSETPMQDLRDASKEIDKLEEKSKNLKNKEEAFTLLRDLNNAMKDVREAALTLDSEYKNMKAGGEEIQKAKQSEDFKKTMKEFSKINADIDSSLAVISKNMEPYKEDEEVKKMLNKLQTLLISR
jgi:predicted  nucleic acid-binding Zn-ribbon protein